MDGAAQQEQGLGSALQVAWSRCRQRLEAARGHLSENIVEAARLATAVHLAQRARRLAADPRTGPTAGKGGRG